MKESFYLKFIWPDPLFMNLLFFNIVDKVSSLSSFSIISSFLSEKLNLKKSTSIFEGTNIFSKIFLKSSALTN